MLGWARSVCMKPLGQEDGQLWGRVLDGTGAAQAGGRDTSQHALAVTDNYHNPKLLRSNKSEKSRTFKLFLISHKNPKNSTVGMFKKHSYFPFYYFMGKESILSNFKGCILMTESKSGTLGNNLPTPERSERIHRSHNASFHWSYSLLLTTVLLLPLHLPWKGILPHKCPNPNINHIVSNPNPTSIRSTPCILLKMSF